jgi:hypothetical protein
MIEKQRTGYVIRGNASNALPRYVISFAVETVREPVSISGRTFHHTFKSAWLIFGRLQRGKMTSLETVQVSSKAEFWAFITEHSKKNYTLWCVSHNCLRDLITAGLTEKFEHGELNIDRPRANRVRCVGTRPDLLNSGICVLDSPPTILGVLVGATQGRVIFVDTMNWFPCSVKYLAGATEIERPGEFEGTSALPTVSNCTEHIAQATFRAFTELSKWVADNNLGMFRYTAAGQAYAAYRHRFMAGKISVHDNRTIKQLERRAYFGGRTEVFRLGHFTETVYQLDSNSLFPFTMREHAVPYILDRYEERCEYLSLLPSLRWENSIAEVELCTPTNTFPLRTPKYVLYPTGTYRTVLAGPELAEAKKRGYIQKMGSWAEYSTDRIFTQFVDVLWAMRQEYKRAGNRLYEQFTKRLMNSLYGKFAQLSAAWIDIDNDKTMLPWTQRQHFNGLTQQWEVYRSFGWQMQKMQPKKEIPGTFVAISAFVTAHARMRMNTLRTIAGRRNVYYQGVDGIICNRDGFEALDAAGEIDNEQLGKLRLEGLHDDCEIMGCSDYRVGGKVVLSGRASQFDDIDTGECLQHKRSATNWLFSGSAVDFYEESLEEWTRTKGYAKGVIGQDGWIDPLELDVVSVMGGNGS